MTSGVTPDPVTLETLQTLDPNGNVNGFVYDGFGRISVTYMMASGGSSGTLSCTTYTGFDTGGPRSVAQLAFSDPATGCKAAGGRLSTTKLDLLGRETETDVSLGASYSATPAVIVGKRTYDFQGRLVFEADPYTSDQSGTPYGTTQFYNADGTPSCAVKGYGQQFLQPTATNEGAELYPTCVTRSFANHVETVFTQDATSLLNGSPQSGVRKFTTLSAIGRTIEQYTIQGSQTLEDELFGYDAFGHVTSVARLQASTGSSATTTLTYSSTGQLTQLQEPGLLPQYRSYDSWGDLSNVSWTDFSEAATPSRVTSYHYDPLGRLASSSMQDVDSATGESTPDPEGAVSYAYDVPLTSGPTGNQVTPTNVLGRLAQATWSTGSVALSYDYAGRSNARVFNADGQFAIDKHTYHADGTLSALDYQLFDNGFRDEHFDYAYDSAGRTLTVNFTDGNVHQSLYSASSIDGLGRTRQAQYGAATYAASYADVGRRLINDYTVSSPLAASAGGGTREVSFASSGTSPAFDPIGRERSRHEITNGDTSAPPAGRTYDSLGRLSTSQGAHTVQFNYDSLGNLLYQQYDSSQLANTIGLHYDSPAQHTSDGLTTDYDRVCQVNYGNTCETPAQACGRLHASCGYVVNNCNQTVLCPDTCASGAACAGTGAGPNSCGTPDPSFDVWSDLSLGVQPLAGDFNGDGLSDIAVVGGCLSAAVAFSHGDGSFSVVTDWSHLADVACSWVFSPGAQMVAGDVDGDGRTDLILAGGQGWTTIPVAFSNGDGTFRVTNRADAGGESESFDLSLSIPANVNARLLAGDVNGDQRADLMFVASAASYINVAASNGDGTFRFGAPPGTVTFPTLANFPTWAAETGVQAATGDFNGDRRTDIVLTGGPGWSTAPVAFSNGDGSFTVANPTAAAPLPSFASFAPYNPHLLVGDFDGDHLSDIAEDVPAIATVFIDHADPAPIFDRPGGFDYTATSGQRGVLGDFNGDGRSDFAIIGGGASGSANTIRVYFADATGTPGGGTHSSTNVALPAPTPAGPNAPQGGPPESGGVGPCTVQYDGLGSILHMPTASGTRDMTYRADGLVRTITNSAGANAHFDYDAFGGVSQLSVAGTASDARQDVHFGPSLLLHSEGGAPVLTRTVPLPGGVIATEHGPDGTWTFQFGERRGARHTVDQNGVFVQDTDYTPYGAPSSTGSASQPGSLLYSSEQWNGGDLLADFVVSHLGARIYDPVVGRFLSRDPLQTPRTATTTSPYAFAMNDPINYSDPTGLDVDGLMHAERLREVVSARMRITSASRELALSAERSGLDIDLLVKNLDGSEGVDPKLVLGFYSLHQEFNAPCEDLSVCYEPSPIAGQPSRPAWWTRDFDSFLEHKARLADPTAARIHDAAELIAFLIPEGRLGSGALAAETGAGAAAALEGEEAITRELTTNAQKFVPPETPFVTGQPHNADFIQYRNGEIVDYGSIASGSQTELEKALKFPRSAAASHSEARGVGRFGLEGQFHLEPGDILQIRGQLPPCNGCKGAMNQAAEQSGAIIDYLWDDGKQAWSAVGGD
jgi:RHS repeat-associated protein